MFDLPAMQRALREFQLDGWLLYDFRGSNVLARRILDMADRPIGSRRFFYFVPAEGTPRRLVHAIETAALDHLPGEKRVYLAWQDLEAALRETVGGCRRMAMEYAPRASNPYVARVDAGTVELVRGCGPEIVSSGDLISQFEATWDDDQWRMHQEASRWTRAAYDVAFDLIRRRVRAGEVVHESDVVREISGFLRSHGLTFDHEAIVGVGPHSGDPHYQTTPATDSRIEEGSFVLIDLWGKLDAPRAVYSDLTRVAFVGRAVPPPIAKVFSVVAAARDAAIACVRDAFAENRPLCGWQVDDAARRVIERAGYGSQFCHRTGHSIGQEIHGNGANMDNLETRDERRVLRRTCFSVEPGIYLAEFGVRSEVDVYIDAEGGVHVTGGDPQTEVAALLTPEG